MTFNEWFVYDYTCRGFECEGCKFKQFCDLNLNCNHELIEVLNSCSDRELQKIYHIITTQNDGRIVWRDK